jgi:hypothetical protein
MPPPSTREEVLAKLRKTVADGSIIVGAGAGRFHFHGERLWQPLTILPQALGYRPKQSSKEAPT